MIGFNHKDTKTPSNTENAFICVLEFQDTNNYSLVNLCVFVSLCLNIFCFGL